MEGTDSKAVKARELSPAMIKEIQALAGAEKRNAEGKATPEDLKVLVNASPSLRREAKKAAGITAPRGKHSAVAVHVNGKNGNPLGWEELYGLKALAGLMDGSLDIRITPEGHPEAKPISAAKLAEFFSVIGDRRKGLNEMTPAQIAAKVAGK